MKNAMKLKIVGALAILGAGLIMNGCKSTPDLSKDAAQALIQAKYDKGDAVPVNIVLTDPGMRLGITAKYWALVKKYPNPLWVDFKLTDDGKKIFALASGGDTIQWHPDKANDISYSIGAVSVSKYHPKAREIGDLQDEAAGKGADYSEAVDLSIMPDKAQEIARTAGNKLSIKRHASFSYEGGAWKLASIK